MAETEVQGLNETLAKQTIWIKLGIKPIKYDRL